MGRRLNFLRLDTPDGRQKALAILGEAADLLNDGFHVTLVEDLRDIAANLQHLPLQHVLQGGDVNACSMEGGFYRVKVTMRDFYSGWRDGVRTTGGDE